MDILLTQSWQLLFIFTLLAGEIWLTWRNPVFGAAAVVFLLPTYIFRIRLVSWFPTNILELALLTFCITVFVSFVRKHERFRAPPRSVMVPFALIVLGASLSALKGIVLAGDDPETVRSILGSLKGFVLEPAFFIALLAFLPFYYRGPTSIVALGAYVGSAVAVAVMSLVGGLFSLDAIPYPDNPYSFLTFDGRLHGFYLSPNHLAMYILPATVLLLGGNPKLRFAIFFVLPALLATLLWTKSLGAILGLTAGFFVYGLWRMALRLHSKRLLSATRYLLFAFVFVGILLPFLSVAFADQIVDIGERSPFASRLMIWRAAIDLLKDHWLLGIGPGAFQFHYLAFQEKYPPYLEWAVPQPHNLFLAVWLQAGLLGLIGFVSLFVLAFRRFLDPRRYTLYPILAAMSAIIVYGFVDTPFWKNDLSVVLFLFAAIGSYLKRNEAFALTRRRR